MRLIWVNIDEKKAAKLDDSDSEHWKDLTKAPGQEIDDSIVFVCDISQFSQFQAEHSVWPQAAFLFIDWDSKEEHKFETQQWFQILKKPDAQAFSVAMNAAKEIAKLKFQLIKVKGLIERDPLTGLLNKRGLLKRFAREATRSKRYDLQLAVLFIDVDYFKNYNDQHGHGLGDKILSGVGKLFKQALRGGDTLARYGGDEFVIILPLTGLMEAHEVAERLRLKTEQLHVPYAYTQPGGHITLSIGVSAYPEDTDLPQEVLTLADKALLKAKASGKNRVEDYSEIDEES